MELAGRKIFGSTAGFNRVLLVHPAVGFQPAAEMTYEHYSRTWMKSRTLDAY
jgi:hypothetical protein